MHYDQRHHKGLLCNPSKFLPCVSVCASYLEEYIVSICFQILTSDIVREDCDSDPIKLQPSNFHHDSGYVHRHHPRVGPFCNNPGEFGGVWNFFTTQSRKLAGIMGSSVAHRFSSAFAHPTKNSLGDWTMPFVPRATLQTRGKRARKLIIQIPCYNEEKALPITLRDLPRELEGVDAVEWLIIDDGSSDDTTRAAHECGVDHIIRLHHHQGLSAAFLAGIDACLKRGADIIVNTDADNQYDARCIPALIQPILDGSAEIVVGDRQVLGVPHFSPLKKRLQKLGSFIVRKLSNTSVQDAPSGFRAFHRRAAMQLNVFNEYSYTIETIIQAGQKNMAITSVPVQTNGELRPSRLMKTITSYVFRMLAVMTRMFVVYRALQTFLIIGVSIMLPGVALGLRYLWLLSTGGGSGNVQSLILAAVFLLSGFFVIMSGLLADLISVNRKLLEEVRSRLINLEYGDLEMLDTRPLAETARAPFPRKVPHSGLRKRIIPEPETRSA